MHYILNHWRGKQSLKQSFWVNLVFGTAIICFTEYIMLRLLMTDLNLYIPISISFFIIFHVCVFIWQSIGTLRACDQNIRQYIASGWTRAAQFTVLLSFTAVMVWGLTLSQSIQRLKLEEQDRIAEENIKPTYELTINGQNLEINGLLDQGITREVKKLLTTKDIRSIEFNSIGGNIFEGRGLAKLIQDNSYSTHVEQVCYSACTTAYIAGVKRTMSEKAKFGFHQYKLDTKKLLHSSVNTTLEQNKDLEYFLQKNIDANFLQKAFSMPYDKMWHPTQDELINAGVIDEIIWNREKM